MLKHSRWQTAAILGVTALVCLAAVPSALPASAYSQLPAWAQRKLNLGYDLQGGERYQLGADVNFLRQQLLESLRDTVRRLLREKNIAHDGIAIRDGRVEVSIRDRGQTSRVLSALESFADRDAYLSISDLDISISGDRMTLAPTETAIHDRTARGVDGTVRLIEQRMRAFGISYTVKRTGKDRIVVELVNPPKGWHQIQF